MEEKNEKIAIIEKAIQSFPDIQKAIWDFLSMGDELEKYVSSLPQEVEVKTDDDRAKVAKDIAALKKRIRVLEENRKLGSDPFVQIQSQLITTQKEFSAPCETYIQTLDKVLVEYDKEKKRKLDEKRERENRIDQFAKALNEYAKSPQTEVDELVRFVENIGIPKNKQAEVDLFNKIDAMESFLLDFTFDPEYAITMAEDLDRALCESMLPPYAATFSLSRGMALEKIKEIRLSIPTLNWDLITAQQELEKEQERQRKLEEEQRKQSETEEQAKLSEAQRERDEALRKVKMLENFRELTDKVNGFEKRLDFDTYAEQQVYGAEYNQLFSLIQKADVSGEDKVTLIGSLQGSLDGIQPEQFYKDRQSKKKEAELKESIRLALVSGVKEIEVRNISLVPQNYYSVSLSNREILAHIKTLHKPIEGLKVIFKNDFILG